MEIHAITTDAIHIILLDSTPQNITGLYFLFIQKLTNFFQGRFFEKQVAVIYYFFIALNNLQFHWGLRTVVDGLLCVM